MHIQERTTGDREELKRLVRGQRDASQRDRYRVVLLALEEQETLGIIKALGRSRGFVQRWAYAYRDGGIAAIIPKPRGGSKPKMTPAQQQAFLQRFQAGPTPADAGVCVLRGRDAQRIARVEFGVNYSLNGLYKLLHRHGLSYLQPRPRHRKQDPEAQRQWLDSAPLLSSR
jgi:transposase